MNILAFSKIKQNASLILLFLLTVASLTIFTPYYASALDLKWVGIAALAIFCLVAAIFSAHGKSTIEVDRIDLYIGGFFLYAAASLAWSPDPRGGAFFLGFFTPLWIVFTYFKNSTSRQLKTLICWGIALAALAVMLIETFQLPLIGTLWPDYAAALASGPGESIWGGLFNRNFITELLLLTLPFIAAIAYTNRRAIYIWLPASGLIVWILYYLVFANPAKMEFFILPAALLAFLAHAGWRKYPRTVALSAIITLIASGFLAVWLWDKPLPFTANTLKSSVGPRGALYWNAFFMWLDKPLLGQGAGGFQAAYPLFQELFIQKLPELGMQSLREKFVTPGSTHNDYLQFLVEFGLVGAALLVMALKTAVSAVRKTGKPDPVVAASLVALVFAAINMAIEFPLQMPSTGLIIVIALGILVNSAKDKLPTLSIPLSRISRTSVVSISIALIGFTSFAAYRLDVAQREFSLVYRLHNVDPKSAYEHHINAYKAMPLDPQIRFLLYQSLHLWNLAVGQPPLSPENNDEIFKTSISAGPQELTVTRRVQYLLDTGRYKSNQAEVERWLAQLRTHSFFRPDTWIADAYYLHLNGKTEEAVKSVNRGFELPHDIAQDQQFFALSQRIANPNAGNDEPLRIE